MSNNDKIPMRVNQCRERLGIGKTRMSAILRRLFPGCKRISYVAPADVIRFQRKNPAFTANEVYPKKTA